ncbi:hypothetical protein ACHAXS_004872 [Conticribra weissflogii]
MTPSANLSRLAILPLLLQPTPTHAILPTAAIDVILPDTNSPPITLLASQASFGAVLAEYSLRFHESYDDGGGGGGRAPGVGVLPAFPPENDPYLCNEAEGWADYRNNNINNDSNNNGNNGNDDELTNNNINNNNNNVYLNNNNNSPYYQSALLVPRGQCSFERKALSAQRLGASAIIVYGSLSSRYSLHYANSTDDCQEASCNDAKTRTDGYYTLKDVVWPGDKFDYDCALGRAWIPEEEVLGKLDFAKLPGGYDERNDAFLVGRGEGNLCVRYDASLDGGNGGGGNVGGGHPTPFAKGCESQRCLVTGRNATSSGDGGLRYEGCCAWDLHIWLYSDNSIPSTNEAVTIPAVYITMEEATLLLDVVRGANDSQGGDPVVLTMYQRYRPEYNVSAVLIWALGVFVAWIASYHSSVEYRRLGKALMARRETNARMEREGMGRGDDDRSQEVGSVGRRGRSRSPPSSSSVSSNPQQIQQQPPHQGVEMGRSGSNISNTERGARGEERVIYRAESSSSSSQPQYVEDPDSLELTASHAVGFIVMASTSLLVLFFFKIYSIVKIMYAFGCSGALAQIVIHPGLVHIFQRIKWDRPLRTIEWMTEEDATRAALRGGFNGHCLICLWQLVGPISAVDIAAMTISYGIGATWLYVAFMIPHPDTIAFYWIIQDVFGLCMCILFLQTIKLNAIKVGAILLIVAFFYDIFFVFVTPLLTKHGESIMVNVATSGGPPKADPAWCEKYPWDVNCKGGDPLPMLFAIPRIGDYQGGSSLLGLGDIVLPGLLLSFASRFDEAKRLIGVVGGGSGRMRNNGCPDGAVGGGGMVKSSNPLCFLLCCCRGGYFGPVMVAYAIGLLMANAAVYIMEMGQPALLYLVPCCLGTMVYMGHKAGELNDLWEGPRVIRSADAFMYGDISIVCGDDDDEQEERDGNITDIRDIDDRSHESRMSNEGSMKGVRNMQLA